MPHVESLQVLYLFAELLDNAFELETYIGQLRIISFRGQCIRFAMKLLCEKIEFAADRAADDEKPFRLLDMRRKPVEFLADVCFCRKQNGLLVQAVGIKPLRSRQQDRDLLSPPGPAWLRLQATCGFRAAGE